ncbi:hypothetical protein VPHK469_0184 [Vibrio phage K469]
MIYKKGHIIPRYLIRAREPKSQHLLKFGCDVRVEGQNIYPISSGNVIVITGTTHVGGRGRKKRHKRIRRVKGYDFQRMEVKVEKEYHHLDITMIYITGQNNFKIPKNAKFTFDAEHAYGCPDHYPIY